MELVLLLLLNVYVKLLPKGTNLTSSGDAYSSA